MAEDEQSSSRPEVRRRAILLTKLQRVAVSVIGFAISGAGIGAVFLTENQAGSTALLLIGGLALLMGLTGRVPDKIGQEGVNYEAVDPATKAVETVLKDDSLPLAVRETIAIAVKDELDRRFLNERPSSLSPAQEAISNEANAVLVEAATRRLLERALPQGMRISLATRANGSGLDGIVFEAGADLSDHRRAIAVSWAARPSHTKLVMDLASMLALNPGGIVYIVPTVLDETRLKGRFQNLVAGMPNARLVVLKPDDENSVDRLHQVLEDTWRAVARD
ncbi:hypothetical protein ACIBI0_17075 [Microbispora rosea]|uniref:hypothetical protein n=1 Tax=Microbispora rosea TaxID=58117 RepID=UPI0037AA189A